jgi:DNA-binding winged helix-turn-helix (wHTH) protein
VSIRFGPFTLDPDSRQLTGATGEIHLTPKAFDLLHLLVAERPKVLHKQDLLARIWPETFVVETNLNGLIGELRRALGDHAREPRFIRTVHGMGFAFSGEATEVVVRPKTVAAPLRCWLTSADRRYVLEEGDNLIGRDPRCHVWLDASRVSREHAQITVDSATQRVSIQDIGSTNGTIVGDVAVTAPVLLSDGDVIEIGSVTLTFHRWAGERSATERIQRRR